MKKSFILNIVLLMSAIILFSYCGKVDYESPAIKGVVTIEDGSLATGAVVYLSTTPNAADVVATAIADSVGGYEFYVGKGTYYLSANYSTDNTNLKSFEVGFMFMTAADVTAEVKKDVVTADLELVGTEASGTDVIELLASPGDLDWEFDAVHSLVEFTFAYDSANAFFSGHFGQFIGVDDAAYDGVSLPEFKFDEANPANTSFEAWVYLPSVETGSPTLPHGHGRDDINGCIANTFGVRAANGTTIDPTDTLYTIKNTDGSISSYFYNETASVDFEAGYAKLVSKSVVAYGNGYMATCDLTFHGFTKEVKLYFHYIAGFEAPKTSSGVTSIYRYSSFNGFFVMQAKSDFNIVSGHVKSVPVTIDIAIQFIKKVS